jgi:hypothetical protein
LRHRTLAAIQFTQNQQAMAIGKAFENTLNISGTCGHGFYIHGS